MNKKRLLGFGFISLAIIIVVSNTNITGAIIGTSTSNYLSLVALVFFIVGGFLILTGKLENKVMGSKVKEDPLLSSVAEHIGENQAVNRDVNHLIKELNKGNTNPGTGTRTVFKGVRELRGPNEGRVYFRQIEKEDDKDKKDKYEILAYSDKDYQSRVINRLKKLYF